jgi:hypothetical protein
METMTTLLVIVGFEDTVLCKRFCFVGRPVALGLFDHIFAPFIAADFGLASKENKR